MNIRCSNILILNLPKQVNLFGIILISSNLLMKTKRDSLAESEFNLTNSKQKSSTFHPEQLPLLPMRHSCRHLDQKCIAHKFIILLLFERNFYRNICLLFEIPQSTGLNCLFLYLRLLLYLYSFLLRYFYFRFEMFLKNWFGCPENIILHDFFWK